MKKLQSIGLSNDEKQRIFEAFIVTWSSYVGSEKLKLLNIGGINSDESAITEVSRWIAETLNIYETGKEKERMEIKNTEKVKNTVQTLSCRWDSLPTEMESHWLSAYFQEIKMNRHL